MTQERPTHTRLPRTVVVATLAILALLSTALLAVAFAQESGGGERHPAAVGAEQAFFAAFNHHAMPPEQVLTPLMGAYASDPADPRTNLFLGATHLWIAAKSRGRNPRVIENLLLAERFFERAQTLAPDDPRIASFLTPVRLSLDGIERRGRRDEIVRDLWAAYARDPAFNSFGVALLGFQSPRGSEDFRRGLEALRAVEAAGCEDGDPTCRNTPRWPHNVEGFVSFYADYELKAGNREAARRLLDEAVAEPSFASWPFRDVVEARLADLDGHAARFADDDPDNDPQPAAIARGCAACHLAGS